MRALPIIRLGRKSYFVDKRLSEIRNIKNPFDAESVSVELIDFWESQGWIKDVTPDQNLSDEVFCLGCGVNHGWKDGKVDCPKEDYVQEILTEEN